MKKTIAALEEELSIVKIQRDTAYAELAALKKDKDFAAKWASRHVELSDRLLNILEWRAKEGKQ